MINRDVLGVVIETYQGEEIYVISREHVSSFMREDDLVDCVIKYGEKIRKLPENVYTWININRRRLNEES